MLSLDNVNYIYEKNHGFNPIIQAGSHIDAGLDAISTKVNSQRSGDYLIIKVLIDSDWTISKGLCSTVSSDVV